MPTLREHQAAICDIGRRIWQRQLVAGFDGNISIRLGKNRVLCTPTGVSKGFMKPSQLCVIDMDAKVLNANGSSKPTSEILLHLQLFAARPDVQSVVHAHPPHATAFACSGMDLPEGIYPEADAMLGRVINVPYTTPGYRALGASVAEAITPETNTVLLGNHGSVHMGRTLEDAYCYLEVLDAYCRILFMLGELGQVAPLTRQQLHDLFALKVARGMPDARQQNIEDVARRAAAFGRMIRRRA